MLNKHIFNSIHNILSNGYEECKSSPLPKDLTSELELVTIQDSDTDMLFHSNMLNDIYRVVMGIQRNNWPKQGWREGFLGEHLNWTRNCKTISKKKPVGEGEEFFKLGGGWVGVVGSMRQGTKDWESMVCIRKHKSIISVFTQEKMEVTRGQLWGQTRTSNYNTGIWMVNKKANIVS